VGKPGMPSATGAGTQLVRIDPGSLIIEPAC
jgi:hypothetical protein